MKPDKELKIKINKKELLDKIDNLSNSNKILGNNKSKKNKARRIWQAVISVILCFVFLFCIFNINYLTPSKMKERIGAIFADMGHGDGYPYSFISDEVLDFFEFSTKDHAILTNTTIYIINSSAKTVLDFPHAMSNPIAKVSSDRVLLFDQGGTKAYVLNQSGKLLTFTNEDKIICGHISNSGKSVLVTKGAGQQQIVNVYSRSGKKIMEWKKGAGYILDIALNSSGNLLSVALVDTDDAVQTITVLTFNVSSAQQRGHREFTASTLYGINYINNNDLVLLCNNKISVLNSKCEQKREVDLPSTNNYQLFIDKKGQVINLYSQYNDGNFTVDVYNAALKNIYKKNCKGEVKKVSSDGKSICVLYSNNTAHINMIGGKITYVASAGGDLSMITNKRKIVYFCSGGTVSREKAVRK